jgi:hypothetical protein
VKCGSRRKNSDASAKSELCSVVSPNHISDGSSKTALNKVWGQTYLLDKWFTDLLDQRSTKGLPGLQTYFNWPFSFGDIPRS